MVSACPPATDAKGNLVTLTYDGEGHLEEIADVMGRQVLSLETVAGKIRESDANGDSTSIVECGLALMAGLAFSAYSGPGIYAAIALWMVGLALLAYVLFDAWVLRARRSQAYTKTILCSDRGRRGDLRPCREVAARHLGIPSPELIRPTQRRP